MIKNAGRRAALSGLGAFAAALSLPHAAPARDAALNARINPIIDAMTAQGFQGVVMLGRAGRPQVSRAIGQANIARVIPMRVDTPLGVASISKRLTAVCVMRLVEQGRLDLDAPITRYLKDYPKASGAEVTLRRLLSNSSGVPNGFTPATRADPTLINSPLTTREAIRRFAHGPLAFQPGTKFDYVLTNWIIVQGVIETVTGRPYPEVMDRLVLKPLGMSGTTLALPADVMSYRTVSPPVEWTNPRPAYLMSGGGYFSTAGDLLRFSHQVYDTPWLSERSRRALTQVEVYSEGYALGGRVRRVAIGDQVVKAAWETGNTNGFRSVLGHRLDGRATVVVLNNTAMSQRLMDEFTDALLAAMG